MDIKEKVKAALPEIKKILFGEDKPRVFKDAKLKDGTIVRYDGETPVQGAPVFVITAEGELPAPTGEHVLEDGTTLVVQDGVIMEVKPAVAEAPEVAEDMAQESEEDRIKKIIETKVKESYFSLEEKFNTLQTKYDALEAAANKSKEVAEKTYSLLEEFTAEPSEAPTEAPKKDVFSLKDFARSVKEAKKSFKNL